jgi:signal recognition particle receptor subunit beta
MTISLSKSRHLHHILHALASLPSPQAPIQLLILAHKSDLLKSSTATLSSPTSNSLAVNRVKTILERELEKRRVSQSSVSVEGLGEEGESSDLGGLECRGNAGFRFAEWEGGDVDFFGTYVKVGEKCDVDEDKNAGLDGLSALRAWFRESAA